jgi:hypothetical protein
LPLDSGEQELLALVELLHQFPLQIANAIQHERFVPQKIELLYWEILKRLGEIWRMGQKFRWTFKDIRV